MHRSFSIAAAATGVVAALTIACSDDLTSSNGTAMESRQSPTSPVLTPQQSGTIQRSFAVSPVNDRVVWASAAGGTYAVTTNGGADLALRHCAWCRGAPIP